MKQFLHAAVVSVAFTVGSMFSVVGVAHAASQIESAIDAPLSIASRAAVIANADTGEVLWEHRFDAGTEGVPAIYEVDGRQYITLPVGGVGHFLGGLGLPDPGPSRYVTFALPAGAQ